MAKDPNMIDVKSETKISPLEISADPKNNPSRFFSAGVDPDDTWLPHFARKLYQEGNLDAIGVTRLADKSLDVVYGFNRHAAGMMIVKGFDFVHEDGSTERIHEPDFKLKVVLTQRGNNRDRLKQNSSENVDRKPLTAMDLASIIRHGRDVCGMNTKELAELIDRDASAVSQYAKLLECPFEVQKLLARVPAKNAPNKLSWRVCAKITELNGELQNKFYEMIRAGEKVTLESIKYELALATDTNEEFDTDDDNEDDLNTSEPTVNGDGDDGSNGSETNGEATGEGTTPRRTRTRSANPPAGPRMQPSVKIVRKLFEEMCGPNEFVPVSTFMSWVTNKFLTGKATNVKSLETALAKFVKESQQSMFEYLKENNLLNGNPDFADIHKTVRANGTAPPAKSGKGK